MEALRDNLKTFTHDAEIEVGEVLVPLHASLNQALRVGVADVGLDQVALVIEQDLGGLGVPLVEAGTV